MAINFGNRRERPTERSTDSSGANVGWNTRFKRASAAKRSGGAEPGRRVGESERNSARAIDPTDYLEAQGLTVRREGRHLSVRTPAGDEAYRVTRQPDGHWVACDLYGNGVGDNVALVQDLEPGTSFPDAVYRLMGGVPLVQAVQPVSGPPRPPRLPRASEADREAGRRYLASRGIDDQTLDDAERTGMLRFVPGGIVYVGLDERGTVRSATRRAIDPADPVQKRDFRGTDKSYAPMLRGDSSQVWVVEGGTDALALHSMFRRLGRALPTVIVSGGSNVLSWVKRCGEALANAVRVVLATEHERDAETLAKVEAGRAKQVAEIEEVIGEKPEIWTPPEASKDLADYHLAKLHEAAQKEEQHASRNRVGYEIER